MTRPLVLADKLIPVSHPYFGGNEKKYVNECLDTMWVSSIGRFIPLFEEAFAKLCEVDYAVACNNGTSALHLALLACGIGPGDEVIVPTLTYIASANAVRYCGARPVLVDSEPRTMNLDPAQVARRVTPRTRAVVAVHLYGHPADMDPILEIARRHRLLVVEDAAEAHGALYRGRRVGSLGHVAAFSFFGNKIITTGEGGMVTTRDRELDRQIRLLRGQGMAPERRYWFPMVGYNYRMTNIQAAIGLAQAEQFEMHFARRRQVANWYEKYLGEMGEFLRLPTEAPWALHAYWSYPVILEESVVLTRDEFMAGLAECGIETRPVFYPLHLMPPYEEAEGSYPVAEALARNGLGLPAHALLEEADVAYITQCIRGLCGV
jgi:perosamine synthetase